MESILVRLMVIAALGNFAWGAADLVNLGKFERRKTMAKMTAKVLKIDWKPISVWPGEGRRLSKRKK